MDEIQNDRKLIISVCRYHGYQINPDAVTFLKATLETLIPNEREKAIVRIVDQIRKGSKPDRNLLQVGDIQKAVLQLEQASDIKPDDIIRVINVFDVPKYTYSPDQNRFNKHDGSSFIFGSATDKVSVYRNRYNMILQKTLHHELFSLSSQTLNQIVQSKSKYKLIYIESVIASGQSGETVVLLGMISQLTERKLYLEDTTGFIQLDLSTSTFHTGLYPENTVVLAEGTYDGNVFTVKNLGFPPPESALVSRSYHRKCNFFGANTDELDESKLNIVEKEHIDSMVVILSEVHLDVQDVLSKLETLFEGYLETPPCLIVLMGNFLSKPYGLKSAVTLRNAFAKLADIALKFSNLVNKTKFVIIPGLDDPGFVKILPRPPFADCITKPLTEKITNLVVASNPARIQFCRKTLVLFRYDTISKLCRNTLYTPLDGSLVREGLSTIVSQAHLCPLPPNVCPIYWNFDYCLYLYPLPDLAVIAEKMDGYTEDTTGCIFTNPGSFEKPNYPFKVYLPMQNEIEDCEIPDK